MVREEKPDIVGHLDKIKIQNEKKRLYAESEAWYKMEVFQLLEEISASSCIIEINTRGVYKKKTPDLYPSKWILPAILDMKIPVTLNSDSHHPDEIDLYFEEARNILLKTGFTHKKIMLNNCWQDVAL